MYCTESDIATARKIAILQSSLTFVSITLFLVVGFLYIHFGGSH
jgi:hypothetical protein